MNKDFWTLISKLAQTCIISVAVVIGLIILLVGLFFGVMLG